MTIRCKVLKPGVSVKQSDGSFIDLAVGDQADFTPASAEWLIPEGFLEEVAAAKPERREGKREVKA